MNLDFLIKLSSKVHQITTIKQLKYSKEKLFINLSNKTKD